MHRKTGWVIGGNAALAAVGYVLGRVSVSFGFEPETGLAVPGSAANCALIVFSLLAAAGAVLSAGIFLRGQESAKSYRSAFAAKRGILPIMQIAAAMLLFLFGVIRFMDSKEVALQERWSIWLEAVPAILAAGGLLLPLADIPDEKKNRLWEKLLLAVVPIFFCIELVLCYRENAADPTLMHYAWKILGLASAGYASYCAAGYASGVCKTRRTFAALFICVYFGGVWLAWASGKALMLPVAVLLIHLGLEIRFLMNLQPKEDRK